MTILFSKLFQFVLAMTAKYEIDESHGLSHSMDVLHFAQKIYESEVQKFPRLKEHERIITTAAIVHDMCDKKYMEEGEGVSIIGDYLKTTNQLYDFEIDAVQKIISTMSYSTVKKRGFPELGEYQRAYHIVREADLLAAYDFDRCMVYAMKQHELPLPQAFAESEKLFHKRVLRYDEQGLLLSSYARKEAAKLHTLAMQRIISWKKLVRK
jgi:HD superfamily phosphodiesterase